jgi:hypothetical protein
MKKNIFSCAALLVILLSSCRKDFVEKDITKQTISINSPANNLVTTSNQVTFWWEAVDGAEKYSLQVVQPDFSSLTKILLDTSMTNTKYSLTLQPGTYQWRIKATNNAGSTAYQTYTFKVDTTSNLTGQLVSDIAPQNSFLTRSSTITFSWNPLNSAVSYEILILNSSGGTVKDTITPNTFLSHAFPVLSAAYSWKVKAQNGFSISQYNSPYTFTIDVTPPAASTPTAPLNGAIITSTAALSWARTGAPDAIYDSVFVATDSAFVNVIRTTSTRQTSIAVNAFSPQLPTGSIYWWRLQSKDSVRNVSVFSNQLKFKLN